jgi:hypothetical protein
MKLLTATNSMALFSLQDDDNAPDREQVQTLSFFFPPLCFTSAFPFDQIAGVVSHRGERGVVVAGYQTQISSTTHTWC